MEDPVARLAADAQDGFLADLTGMIEAEELSVTVAAEVLWAIGERQHPVSVVDLGIGCFEVVTEGEERDPQREDRALRVGVIDERVRRADITARFQGDIFAVLFPEPDQNGARGASNALATRLQGPRRPTWSSASRSRCTRHPRRAARPGQRRQAGPGWPEAGGGGRGTGCAGLGPKI